MPSLALIFHLLDAAGWAVQINKPEDPPAFRFDLGLGKVSVSCVSKAIGWCEYLESHARRVYGLATNIGIRAASILADKINEGKLEDGFSRRIIRRKGWKLLPEDSTIQEAVDVLIDKKIIRELPNNIDKRKGGPAPLPIFEINPKFFPNSPHTPLPQLTQPIVKDRNSSCVSCVNTPSAACEKNTIVENGKSIEPEPSPMEQKIDTDDDEWEDI